MIYGLYVFFFLLLLLWIKCQCFNKFSFAANGITLIRDLFGIFMPIQPKMLFASMKCGKSTHWNMAAQANYDGGFQQRKCQFNSKSVWMLRNHLWFQNNKIYFYHWMLDSKLINDLEFNCSLKTKQFDAFVQPHNVKFKR